jgi:hypothetical protein
MNWGHIEAILAEIERLDAETAGKYRQISDREVLDICSWIERKMLSLKRRPVEV